MVGVAEGGAGGSEPYWSGEYYPPEHYYPPPPELCAHPQHPHHPHMCTVHADYGGVSMPVVTSGNMLPPMMQPVLDESGTMRHYLMPHAPLPAHAHPAHAQHHQHHAQHQHPPHHQPPHHYGPANGAGGPQQFYTGPGYPPPPHFHQMPSHHMQHSPPPPVYQKDERTQRQYTKLKRRLEQKNTVRNNGVELHSGASTPSLSPRKELNGTRGGSGGASSGAWSEGEGSSAASLQGDDDDTQAVLDALSATYTPQVSEMTPTSALVQWNSPAPEGVALPNVELTYDLLLGDHGRYKAIYSGPSRTCRVLDLKPGCQYSVCLQIRAGKLTGAASEAATFRAPAAAPAVPPQPRITQRARTTLLVRWGTSPDNGARILNYLVEMDSGEGFVEIGRTRTRQHTTNNLRPQTYYRFRVAAVNDCGQSPWSDEVAAWTTGAPPLAPNVPELSNATSNTLLLAWERRTPEEEFTLQMDDRMRGHGFLPVYSGSDLQHLCSGLYRSTDYVFRLRCETVDGQGPWSSEVTYRTLPERPGPPGRPAARGKIHSRTFRLRWEPPTDSGGAEVGSYTLELDGGEGYRQAYNGTEREAHCDRLLPGTPYRARVSCVTVAGSSDWSTTETVTTEAMIPGACGLPELINKPRATSVAIRWQPPECSGGAVITEYRVERILSTAENEVVYSGLEPECVIRELSPGCSYEYHVIAGNRVGFGAPSPPLAITTAAAPPDAPAPLSAFIESPQSARLEWSVPCDNGAPIIDYRLEFSSSNVSDAFSEIFKGAATSYVVKKLTPFSPYFFRVCATNGTGRGPWSSVRDILTPRAAPAAPAGIKHESTADSLHLSWRAPADHGAEILRYVVEIGEARFETEGPSTVHTVEGLTAETLYKVRVAGVNDVGTGDWSEFAKALTRPPPPKPPQLECAQRAHNFLKMKWGEGAAPESTQYCLEMRGPESRDFRPAYRGSARSCKVKKLREATTYSFRIRASDERGGRGEFSESFEAGTCAAPPPAMRAPTVEILATRAAVVEWEVLEDSSYVLQCARGKEATFKQVYAGSDNQFQLEELEAGAEYALRVCSVRGGLAGAWSGIARLSVPVPPTPAPRVRRARPARSLTSRHVALLLAGGFLLLAVFVAIILQKLVEPRP